MGLIKHFKFQSYYLKYFDKIYNFVYFRTGNNEQVAEDLTQEIFIRAYENFESFDERVKFSTWIYTIAKNKIIDEFRKKKLEKVDVEKVEKTLAFSESASETFIKELELSINMESVKKGLDKLPEKHKEIIILKYVNDLENSEICEILNQSSNYVRVNLHRALTKLASLLKDN